MSKRKYENGDLITSMIEFVNSESVLFKVHGRTWHRAALENQQYAVLNTWINHSAVYEAKLINRKNADE